MSSTSPTSRTTPDEITAAVIERFEACSEPRLRAIMQSLVCHLHGFAKEVDLSEAEWQVMIENLTATGHITDDRRQEFILWSDTLGLSMLVDALANQLPEGATESTVLGPFYVAGSPLRDFGADIAEEEAGVPAWVHGRIVSTDGEPLDAELDVWQNGDNRLYAVQDPDAPEDHLRGRFRTREDGGFAFLAVRPVPYPIPDDGPVGKMLEATGRHPWRPAHIHMIARAPGHRTVTTHIFDEESEYLDSDAVFAVKPSLLRRFETRSADDPETPEGIERDWVSLECDIVLTPSAEAGEPVDRGRTH
ncbi:MAG TPA: dioxygenase [Solirubrobacterales bacterium]|jgi:catechol 1,2-dioxygenase|nr:dioxygenase [Solirubrobacterales bacterium]